MANITTFSRNGLSPFAAFDDMDRVFDNLLGNLRLTVRPESQSALAAFTPKIDVTESDASIEVAADLPGLDINDVTLDIKDNVLTIQGEKKSELEKSDEQSGRTVYRMERVHGSFLRRIALPTEIESEHTEATFKNGVLRVVLPKAAKSQPKQITIKAE